ncbi:MAG: NUDIX hydrolase [Gemmatimonadetes bacterium]|nr:NUDIX hydrolase [Gemmatimonadota bacterium]MYA42188.1 NUDIX hydrolase [Gemmatimonadota bacterium]MYJ09844.1 NUDIX hydrolase [Gemmatimonadota bacterium]
MPRGTDGGGTGADEGPRGDDGSPRPGVPAPYDIPEERLPPGFIETLDNVPATPAVPHPSATVVLMREGEGGPEVLLLRRNRATGFVPGAYVFPGGRVDAADGEDALAERWDGLTRGAAAGRLGIAPDADPPAIAYYGAALREAIEETGLLAGVVAANGPPHDDAVREAREALLGGGASFAAVLRQLGARLDGGAVEYIAHWVTPEVEPRRYDTRFFAARVPAGSKAVYDRREMTDAVWLTPRAALDRHRRGGLPMIFPTIRTLEDLCDFVSVEELLTHYRARAIERVQPTIVRTATGVRLRVP